MNKIQNITEAIMTSSQLKALADKYKRQTKISLDVDGILADFYLEMCKKYHKPYAKIDVFYVDWINKYIDTIKADAGFWMNLPTMLKDSDFEFD